MSSGRRFIRHALEFRVLAVVEVKDKHLHRGGSGLEAALVGRAGGVEVAGVFGEILLFLLVILADEEVAVLDGDGEYDVRGERVVAGEAVELVGGRPTCLCSFSLGSGGSL